MSKALIFPTFPKEVIEKKYRLEYFKNFLPAEILNLPFHNYTLSDMSKIPTWEELENFIQTFIDNNYNLFIGEAKNAFLWFTILRLLGNNTPAIIFARINPYEIFDLLSVFFFSQVCLPSDKIITGSESSAKIYSYFGFETFVSHQGIDFNIYKPLEDIKDIKKALGYKEYETILLYTGRLERDKNVLELIKTFLEINSKIPNLKLIIATVLNDLEYYNACINLIVDSQKVKFYFSQPKENINKLYNIADYFITFSTSCYETFGRSPIESIACETPIIVPDYDGFGENFLKGSGYLLKKVLENGKWIVKKDEAKNIIIDAIENKDFSKRQIKEIDKKLIDKFDKKNLTAKNIRLAREIINKTKLDKNFQNCKIDISKYPKEIKNIFENLDGTELKKYIKCFFEKKVYYLNFDKKIQEEYYKFIFKNF